ncbi:MAG: nuclear transport factor 2 family protein [Verrucomicrobiae bacterium]|nr:nuclear transport factor 2 family protein [Verrucomicrobiae bacterium]
MERSSSQINRVEVAELEAASVRLPQCAGVFMREIGALAEAYFGAIDQGDVESALGHLDPNGFTISFPGRTLASEDDYRAWYSGIESTFSHLNHTVVALEPKLVTQNAAQVTLSVHGPALGHRVRREV